MKNRSCLLEYFKSSLAILLSIIWAYALFFQLGITKTILILILILTIFSLFYLIKKVGMFKASLSRRIIYWISWFSFNEIFLLALFLRVGWILSAGTIQVSDFARYDRTAIEILEGGPLVGYPWSASGTPILAAAIYSIVGYHPLVVLFLMGILGAFQAGLIYLLSKRIWKNQTAAACSGLIFAIWPTQIIYSSLISSDLPFTMFFLLSIWFLVLWIEKPLLKFGFCFGVMLGLSFWIRSISPVFFIAGLLIFLTYESVIIRTRIFTIFVSSVGFVILIIPIMILNNYYLGFLSPYPSQVQGYNLVMGTNLGWSGQNNPDDAEMITQLEKENGWQNPRNALNEDAYLRTIAIGRIQNDPERFMIMAIFIKPTILWGNAEYTIWSLSQSRLSQFETIVYLLANSFYQPILIFSSLVLMVLGLGKFKRNSTRGYLIHPGIFYMILCGCGITLTHMIQETQPRYHYPLIPFLAILVGLGVDLIIKGIED